jgi:peptide deformylase
MHEIITDLEKLSVAAKPAKFSTDSGLDTEETDKVITAIKEAFETRPELLAISAPQLGIDMRVIGLQFSDQIKILLNPIITKKSKMALAVETCASLPGKEIVIKRPTEITAVYYTDKYKYEENKFIGASAALLDQMSNLLDGITPDRIGLVSDVAEAGHVTDEDLADIAPIYQDFVNSKLSALKKDIEADEALAKEYRQLSFQESVINGRTAVVESEEEASVQRKTAKLAERSIAANAKQKDLLKKAQYQSFIKKVTRR